MYDKLEDEKIGISGIRTTTYVSVSNNTSSQWQAGEIFTGYDFNIVIFVYTTDVAYWFCLLMCL